MIKLSFAGIPDHIHVFMNNSEYCSFLDYIKTSSSCDGDLSFYKIARWIRINILAGNSEFLNWYDKTDTEGWFYPYDKIMIEQQCDDKDGFSRAIINGLTKPIFYPNSNYDMELARRQMPMKDRFQLIMEIPTSLVHIKDVIFNNPATIVFWSDGTKTVCTCSEADTYDPEKGLALCCMKKLLYKNKGYIFNNAREKWLKKAKK